MSYIQGTRKYQDLVDYTESICSVKFNTDNLTRVNTLINQSIRTLYDRYPFWSRYLVVGEPRSVDRGYVHPDEDSYHVWGAGSDIVNGLYRRNGDANGRPRYTKSIEDGTNVAQIFYDSLAPIYLIYDLTHSPSLPLYSNDSVASIPTDGWETVPPAESPPPIVQELPEIGQFLTIHRCKPEVRNGLSRNVIDFIVTTEGARLATHANEKIVYVTYKKKLPEKFGKGEDEEGNIPNEFFDYAALNSARMFNLSKQINTDPQVRNITLREIEDAANHQLMIQERNNPDFIQRRTFTNF